MHAHRWWRDVGGVRGRRQHMVVRIGRLVAVEEDRMEDTTEAVTVAVTVAELAAACRTVDIAEKADTAVAVAVWM